MTPFPFSEFHGHVAARWTTLVASCALFSLGSLAACDTGSGTSASGDDAAPDQSAADSTTSHPDAPSGSDGSRPDSTAADVANDVSSDAGGIVDADGGASVDAEGGDEGSEAGADAGDSGPTCAPFDASAVDASAVAAGMALVQNFSCLPCHGDPPVGKQFSYGYSKNLTPDPATGLGCWSDQQIVTAILDGVTPDGETLCIMPRWGSTGFQGNTLDAGSAEQIVQYLRTLAPVVHTVPPTACPAPSEAGADAAGEAGDAAVE
jgi:hypothetical protein